jgi:hypothetical protein
MLPALYRNLFALLTLASVCSFPPRTFAQSPVPPYGLKVSTQPGLLVVTFQTQQGSVRAYLPDKLFPGKPFSGTVEAPPEGASSAPTAYFLQLADQQVMVKNRTFNWTAPAEAGAFPLRLRDFQGNELAHYDLYVSLGPHPQPIIPEQFRVPDVIQSNTPIPVLGPFDGNSSSTTFKLAGSAAEVLTEVPGKAMILSSTDQTGLLHYEVAKSSRKSDADTRVLSVRLIGLPTSFKKGRRYKIQLVVNGLAGIQQNTEIKLEIVTPAMVSIEAYPPLAFRPHDLEYIYIRPEEVGKDGTYTTRRTLQGIQSVPIQMLASVVMPLTPHEVVEQILRTPRLNLRTKPGQEHAEALKPFGEETLPLLAEFLTGDFDLSYEALQTMLIDPDRAAPRVIAAIPRMQGQPQQIAFEVYTNAARDNPAFPHRRELHDAAFSALTRGGYLSPNMAAVSALGVVGSELDFPILEQVYQNQSDSKSGNALIRNASEAALARLGSQPHIANIKQQLSTVVKNTGDAAVFEQGAKSAVFTGNQDFVPLLCAHLHDPSWDFGDYGDYPSQAAELAIDALLDKPVDAKGVEVECQARLQAAP